MTQLEEVSVFNLGEVPSMKIHVLERDLLAFDLEVEESLMQRVEVNVLDSALLDDGFIPELA